MGDDRGWHRARRRDRRGDCPPHPHDGDARAGRRLPFSRWSRCGSGCGRGLLCAGGIRHRHAGRDPHPEPGRDVARGGDRRHHLHRLDHRLLEAFGAHVGQADHPARAPRSQYRARARAHRLHRHVLPAAERRLFLGDRATVAPSRRADYRSDRRRRHAGRYLDAEFLFGDGQPPASASLSAIPR